METKTKTIIKTTGAALFAAILGFIVALYVHTPQSFTVFARIPNTQTPLISPTTTPAKPSTVSQTSSDGTKKIIIAEIQNADTTKTYYVSVADSAGLHASPIFTKTLDQTKTMILPFNTWSPDNKYFFIQEQTTTGMVTGILALQATGKPFANGQPYLDVTNVFINRNTGYTLREATGWASETLIIINSVTPENKKGPSYWFEVPSTAIIQLSTDF